MADTADLKTVKLKWPAICRTITQAYGNKSSRYVRGYHTGIDIACAPGSPIFAAHDGTITFKGFNGAYGNEIRISLNDKFVTSYHHLTGFRKGLQVGQNVSAGTIVGYMGSTGQSTGPHLHFEIRINGADTDPKPYLDGVLSPGGSGIVQVGTNPIIPDWAEAAGEIFQWLSDSKSWLRIGMVLLGAILLLMTFVGIAKTQALGKAGISAVKKVVNKNAKT